MADTPATRREQTGCIQMSRDQQTDQVTAENTNMLQHPVELGSRMNFQTPDRTDDGEEINCVEGATQTFEPSHRAEGTFTQAMARPHTINHMMTFAMGGTPTDTSVGATGFRHDGAWLVGNLVPTMTVVQREANRADYEQYVGCAVNTLQLSLADNFVAMEASLMGTGLRNTQSQRIFVTALDNAVSLTLTDDDSNDFGVAGSDGPERLLNVSAVRAKVDGTTEWVDANVTLVSGATPAILTIDTIGGAGASVVYEVFFFTSTGVAWATPASGNAASPLTLVNAQVNVMGSWDGTTWTDGFDLDATTGETVEFNLNNNLVARNIPNQSQTLHAQEIRRSDQREATITLTRRFADPIYKLLADQNTQDFSLRFVVQGAVMDAGDTERYGFEIVIPQARFTSSAEVTTEEGELAHTLNIKAMNDTTYNLFDFNGWDTVASYMA